MADVLQTGRPSRALSMRHLGWLGIVLLGGLIALLAVVRSPRTAVDSGAVVLRIKSLPNLDFPNITTLAKSKILNEFLKSHPNITFQRVSDLRIPNAPSTELLSIAGQIAPDVFYLPFTKVRDYIDEGFIVDISDELADWEDRQFIAANLWPVAMKDGRYYGIPTDELCAGVTFNANLVSEAGLDPDHPPKTWQELFHWAQVLTDRDKVMYWGERKLVGRWGLGWLLGETIVNTRDEFDLTAGEFFANLVWQMGGVMASTFVQCSACKEESAHGEMVPIEMTCDHCGKVFLTADAAKRYGVTYDSPEAVAALEIIQKFRWAYWFRDTEGRIINLCDSKGAAVITDEQFEQLREAGGDKYTD